jgi:hypothetical protein
LPQRISQSCQALLDVSFGHPSAFPLYLIDPWVLQSIKLCIYELLLHGTDNGPERSQSCFVTQLDSP